MKKIKIKIEIQKRLNEQNNISLIWKKYTQKKKKKKEKKPEE